MENTRRRPNIDLEEMRKTIREQRERFDRAEREKQQLLKQAAEISQKRKAAGRRVRRRLTVTIELF